VRFIWSHIQRILYLYDGTLPLHHFLKNYYYQNHKLGSRDRKILSEMIYCWYRCSSTIVLQKRFENEFEVKMSVCLALCSHDKQFVDQFKFQGIEPGKGIDEMLGQLTLEGIDIQIGALFPYEIPLSAGVSRNDWLYSMIGQPAVFIRLRQPAEEIAELLTAHETEFTLVSPTCMSLPTGTKIEKILPEDSYVVQDASSQQTGAYFMPEPGQSWYDCCAGAGGKSLLLKDIQPAINLTVSDIRQSIIYNLKERFNQYHHPAPAAAVVDCSDRDSLESNLRNRQFDRIICDVPCSGSGTWARTPEQLYFFKPEKLQLFCETQQTIVNNVWQYLKPGGRLFYITCSVFYVENEAAFSHLQGATILETALINGIAMHADCMYIAVLQKQ
jgi:16S rRNA (cytosine967-C5)-methyltransferase